jgi:hypothetical protein
MVTAASPQAVLRAVIPEDSPSVKGSRRTQRGLPHSRPPTGLAADPSQPGHQTEPVDRDRADVPRLTATTGTPRAAVAHDIDDTTTFRNAGMPDLPHRRRDLPGALRYLQFESGQGIASGHGDAGVTIRMQYQLRKDAEAIVDPIQGPVIAG